jgi:cytochrome c553
MKKFVAISILIVSVLLIAAVSYVFIRSNAIIHKKYNVALVDIAIPRDSISLAAGKKIALTTRGCYGCHTKNLGGYVETHWEGDTGADELTIANISKVIPQYSDRELFRLLKHGIKKDGTGLWGMPVGMFVNLSEKDISRLIAHLRTVPAVENELPKTSFTLRGRMKIISGEVVPEVTTARKKAVNKFQCPAIPTVVQQGNYLALTTCVECHGYDLRGAFGTPPLTIAKAYKEAEFVKFLKTGKALGDRELPLMSDMCRQRFTNFSEGEIKAIYAFLVQSEK